MKRNCILWIAFLLAILPALAQKTGDAKFFDPNPSVEIDMERIADFLAEIPEISTKSDYYKLSKKVLQTLLVVQSNAGRSICDGQFNYSRAVSSVRNKKYESFARSKNGFVVCEKRSRGVELAALSMHQMRNDGKTTLSDEQWLQMIFGPGSDLESLSEVAMNVFHSLSGKTAPAPPPPIVRKKEKPTTETAVVVAPTVEKSVEKAEKPTTEMPVVVAPTVEKVIEKAEKPAAEKPVVAVPTVEKMVEKAEKPTAEMPVVAAPTVEKSVEKAEKPTAEMPVVAAPTVEKMVEKPTETVPKAAGTTSSAQEVVVDPMAIVPVKTRRNVIKSNVLFPLALGYERGFGEHFSVALSGFFMPKVSIGDPVKRSFGKVSLVNPSVGFSAEGRYYLSKKKAPINGLYLDGFFTRRDADVSIRTITTTDNSRTDATITIPTGLIAYGVGIGKQRIRKKGWTTDFSLGVGPFRVYSIPDIGKGGEEPFKTLSRFTKYKAGIGPRISASFGYAF